MVSNLPVELQLGSDPGSLQGLVSNAKSMWQGRFIEASSEEDHVPKLGAENKDQR